MQIFLNYPVDIYKKTTTLHYVMHVWGEYLCGRPLYGEQNNKQPEVCDGMASPSAMMECSVKRIFRALIQTLHQHLPHPLYSHPNNNPTGTPLLKLYDYNVVSLTFYICFVLSPITKRGRNIITIRKFHPAPYGSTTNFRLQNSLLERKKF